MGQPAQSASQTSPEQQPTGDYRSEYERARDTAYENELVQRLQNNLPMHKADKREARRILAARGQS